MNPALAPSPAPFARDDGRAALWTLSPQPVPYPDAVSVMEDRVEALIEGRSEEMVWLLEHPALYTAGVSARPEDLLQPDRLPVFPAARGGKHTYHGPGQRVVYVMLDLRRRRQDVRAFVAALEAWLIETLASLGVLGAVRPGRVGVWVDVGAEERKIAAVGLKLRRWVSFHGISLNVAPDLNDFAGIVPCGIAEHGVTSLAALGAPADMARVDLALRDAFERQFGATRVGPPPL
ncbi:MAG: lipoyl(octanoyl) transferase LipB [Alphaproteobacteria bacterium]|nr:lipoyl(octanoyl) transferase LipB [Alphaproteobacteria bacterium]